MAENRIQKVVDEYAEGKCTYEHALGMLEAFGMWAYDADKQLAKAVEEKLKKN